METIAYMHETYGKFGFDSRRQLLPTIGMNKKGGMDDKEFLKYLQALIMRLFPDAQATLASHSKTNSVHFDEELWADLP